MKCHSKKILLSALHRCKAFTLIETLTALAVLAIVSSSVLVVINRCVVSAADLALRMQAFEIARENMEKLLVLDSVTEAVEYGSTDEYPEVQWQTTIELFYEPLTKKMWVRAVCSAEYTDAEGEVQTVELTHWLTDLTEEQLLRITKEREEAMSAEKIIKTEEEAADYAVVDVQTIQQWVENGMPRTEDGYYIKSELDLYKQTDGSPTIEDRIRRAKADADLLEETNGEPNDSDKQPENLGEQDPLGSQDGYEDFD